MQQQPSIRKVHQKSSKSAAAEPFKQVAARFQGEAEAQQWISTKREDFVADAASPKRWTGRPAVGTECD